MTVRRSSSATSPRVYCPTCGQVRTGGQYTHPANGNAIVYSHKRVAGGDQLCPGGPITMGEDKAP